MGLDLTKLKLDSLLYWCGLSMLVACGILGHIVVRSSRLKWFAAKGAARGISGR